MGPTWVLSAQGGSHVGPMNLAIRVVSVGVMIPTLSSMATLEVERKQFLGCLTADLLGTSDHSPETTWNLSWYNQRKQHVHIKHFQSQMPTQLRKKIIVISKFIKCTYQPFFLIRKVFKYKFFLNYSNDNFHIICNPIGISIGQACSWSHKIASMMPSVDEWITHMGSPLVS